VGVVADADEVALLALVETSQRSGAAAKRQMPRPYARLDRVGDVIQHLSQGRNGKSIFEVQPRAWLAFGDGGCGESWLYKFRSDNPRSLEVDNRRRVGCTRGWKSVCSFIAPLARSGD